MTRPLVIAIAVACAALPGVASARPRVALTPFEGDAGGEVQDAVIEILGDDLVVVAPKQVGRTVDKLGLDGELSDKDLKKLANELEADAVVQTRLSTKGGNRVLHFKLFVHGKSAKGFKIEFASLKSSKFKQMLRDKMVDKVGGAKPGGDDADADAKPAKKKKKANAADDEDPVPSKRPTKKQPQDDSAEADAKPVKKSRADDADDDRPVQRKSDDSDDDAKPAKKSKRADTEADDDAKPRKAKKRTARHGDDDAEVEARSDAGDEEGLTLRASPRAVNRDAVRVDAGLSVTSRKLTFVSRAFPQAPTPYKNSPVPGVRVAGEIFPFAFGDPKAPVAGLGFAGELDQTLSLSVASSTQPGSKFPVTERHYSVGVRYRLVIGAKPTSPSITAGIGYGHRTFKIDRSQLQAGNIIDLPDTDYVGFDPGIDVRIPIVPAVSVVFGGRGLLLSSAGSIVTASQYGQAKVTGAEGMAGLDIAFGNRVALRLVGEIAQFGYAFTGTGAMANNRDMDPTTIDVGGATDRYIGGAATLAVLY